MNNTNSKEEVDKAEIKKVLDEITQAHSLYILLFLQAIINEQIQMKSLDKNVGRYLYDALKTELIQKGWFKRNNEG